MGEMWKENWDEAKRNFTKWWRHEGPVLMVTAPKDKPWEDMPEPAIASDMEMRWLDPYQRVKRSIYSISRRYFGGDAFPLIETNIGPGTLGMFLGSEPELTTETVWYRPCIDDPDTFPEMRFSPDDYWFNIHRVLLETGVRLSKGRYIVGMPDLIENIDILAQLREPQTLMIDMLERPAWVEKCVAQINRVYFDAFDKFNEVIKTPEGGNAFCAFHIWGPGKTAKLQCDASAMFSSDMFRRFVVPSLTEQCRWLDYSMYHLDGTQAMHHLDALLEIEALDAIEWTPQAGIEPGGHERWWPMYRKILKAGKSVQVIGIGPEEVIPLFECCGSDGVYVMTGTKTEADARRLADKVDRYRK